MTFAADNLNSNKNHLPLRSYIIKQSSQEGHRAVNMTVTKKNLKGLNKLPINNSIHHLCFSLHKSSFSFPVRNLGVKKELECHFSVQGIVSFRDYQNGGHNGRQYLLDRRHKTWSRHKHRNTNACTELMWVSNLVMWRLNQSEAQSAFKMRSKISSWIPERR